jgi:hypothetical protein
MKKLIRVVRSAYTPEFHPEGGHNWRRRLPMVIIPVTRELDIERSNMSKDAEFLWNRMTWTQPCGPSLRTIPAVRFRCIVSKQVPNARLHRWW